MTHPFIWSWLVLVDYYLELVKHRHSAVAQQPLAAAAVAAAAPAPGQLDCGNRSLLLVLHLVVHIYYWHTAQKFVKNVSWQAWDHWFLFFLDLMMAFTFQGHYFNGYVAFENETKQNYNKPFYWPLITTFSSHHTCCFDG